VRTLEQGHTKKCLAAAMICVIENMRDDQNYTDTGFAIDANANMIYHTAFEYLMDGTKNCTCPDGSPETQEQRFKRLEAESNAHWLGGHIRW
jgi:hypothetical protein